MSQFIEVQLFRFIMFLNMVAIKLELLLFLNILYVANGERRISHGKEVSLEKRYVVYLVKAPDSIKIFDEWLCGGSLVSRWFIITSAACVTDVEHMYAIAGYNKYVPDAEIETDKCTKEKKKKVVYTCVPMNYNLNYIRVETWSYVDIALVKVESAYDFDDTTFNTLCSYIPTVIDINYENKFQKPGTDTLVYGWGHTTSWRQVGDNSNYNNPTLQYGTSKIVEKLECIDAYTGAGNISDSINQFMICTSQRGEFNDKGEFSTVNPPPKLVGCNNKQLLNHSVVLKGEIVPSPNTSASNDTLACEDDDPTYPDILIDATRRGDENTNQTSSGSLQNKNRTVFNRTTTRKGGSCQNDHGGPLVTWVGGNEILIGIASLFIVADDYSCMGPYLYSSTQCNGAFIDCILSNSDLPEIKSRRALCDSPPIQRGYDTVERYISWEHHPSGTADNERNAIVKITNYEKKRRYLQSPETLQKLMRFDMLVKVAKEQSKAILRQQRQRV